jgi:hypothetical protein
VSIQCFGSRSGIQWPFLTWIRDPGWKNPDPGFGINIPDPQLWFHLVHSCKDTCTYAQRFLKYHTSHHTKANFFPTGIGMRSFSNEAYLCRGCSARVVSSWGQDRLAPGTVDARCVRPPLDTPHPAAWFAPAAHAHFFFHTIFSSSTFSNPLFT